MNIRWLLQKDIKSILEIQKLCPYAPQWTKKDYIEANRAKKNSFLESKNFPIIYVCELEKQVIGYLIYKVHLADVAEKTVKAEKFFLSNSKAVDFCLKNGSLFYGNIISFCIHPNYRNKGHGRALFDFVKCKFSQVIDLSKDHSFRPFMLFATVSEKDLGVLNFLKKMNFYADRISWNHYGPDHDGYNFFFYK